MGSGQLSHDQIYSPEQVVIDREILLAAGRLIQGLQWQPQSSPQVLQALQEGLDRGTFLDHDSTIDNFRTFFSDRGLFRATDMAQWQNKGSPSIPAEASRIVEARVQANTFRRSDDQIKRLREICDRGERILTGGE
jgi:trimethylamine:corrinoid methyltransferase-like protein